MGTVASHITRARHAEWTCACGASVIFGDLATDADVEAWGAEHLRHAVVHLEAAVAQVEPVYGGDVVLGLSVLGPHEAFPVLRGRSVILRFFGVRPSQPTTEALGAELTAAGADVLGIEGGFDPLGGELPPPGDAS